MSTITLTLTDLQALTLRMALRNTHDRLKQRGVARGHVWEIMGLLDTAINPERSDDYEPAYDIHEHADALRTWGSDR